MLMSSSGANHSVLLGASLFVSKTNESYERKYKRGTVLLEIHRPLGTFDSSADNQFKSMRVFKPHLGSLCMT